MTTKQLLRLFFLRNQAAETISELRLLRSKLPNIDRMNLIKACAALDAAAGQVDSVLKRNHFPEC